MDTVHYCHVWGASNWRIRFSLIILFSGIFFRTASWMALTSGLFAIFLFLVIPFSEEPWLSEQYGKQYEDYCRLVPRFVGVRSFKPLIPKTQ
ncbi:hypothetical protein GX563_12935 [Candidatus Bathyarchaeota archaeon]|nr:hypothetical protein [Candidatus Bathyarchaeota archaeon]